MRILSHKYQQTIPSLKMLYSNLGDHKLWVYAQRLLLFPPPHDQYRTLHLAPPEKGKNEWLCLAESGANRKGSYTCRETSRIRIDRGQAPDSDPYGDRISRGGCRRRWCPQRSCLLIPSGPPYLWVWPHF